MSLFGDFYEKPLIFRRNKKELMISHSEDWSAAILSGSSDLVAKEEPVNRRIYWLIGLVLVIGVSLLMLRLFNVQIIQGKRNALLASSKIGRAHV